MNWVPTVAADTFEGQVLWFVAGFVYVSVIMSVVAMIRLFRKASGGHGGPTE